MCLHVDMRLKKKAQVTGETSTKGTDTQGQMRKQEDTTDDGVTQSVPVKGTSKTTLADLKKQASSSKSSTDTGGPPNVKKQKTDSGMPCVASFTVSTCILVELRVMKSVDGLAY